MSPFVLVILGATGDLARHKLFPALFALYKRKEIGDAFYIVGFSRREISDDEYRVFLAENVKVDPEDETLWNEFVQHVYYQSGLFNEEKGYVELIEKLNKFDTEIGACVMRIFYLATPPDNYMIILDKLRKTKLSEGCGQGSAQWTHIAIEKPFGKDLQTAKQIDMKLGEVFNEKQIFRVDHYLAKETVQNILAFRFANGIFDPVWNKNHIDHVQITFAEKKGVETRGQFFDGVGILRDVAQNHLLQLVAAVAMEQPKSFSREDVRDARVKAIQAIECIEPGKVPENVVRGQYVGYNEHKGIDPSSVTETFVAMKFFVNSERFQGVPFYMRAGKEMPENVVEIKIVFIQTCHILFKEYGCPEVGNVLTIRIQPDEGISLRVIAKAPGNKLSLETIDMNFSYKDHSSHRIADAYEKLLLDIMHGDQMLFNRTDELESSWTFITNILEGWSREVLRSKGSRSAETISGSARKIEVPVHTYEPGTWGPEDADHLIEKDGRHWL